MSIEFDVFSDGINSDSNTIPDKWPRTPTPESTTTCDSLEPIDVCDFVLGDKNKVSQTIFDRLNEYFFNEAGFVLENLAEYPPNWEFVSSDNSFRIVLVDQFIGEEFDPDRDYPWESGEDGVPDTVLIYDSRFDSWWYSIEDYNQDGITDEVTKYMDDTYGNYVSWSSSGYDGIINTIFAYETNWWGTRTGLVADLMCDDGIMDTIGTNWNSWIFSGPKHLFSDVGFSDDFFDRGNSSSDVINILWKSR
jgi:hypothetical protein